MEWCIQDIHIRIHKQGEHPIFPYCYVSVLSTAATIFHHSEAVATRKAH